MKKIFYFLSFFFTIAVPLGAFATTFEHDLFFGMRNHEEVKQLQTFLRDRGFFTESITGNFLLLTKQAVADFQQKEGIMPAQGYVGPKTRAKVNALLSMVSPASKEELIASLKVQIQAIKEKIAHLLAKAEAEKQIDSLIIQSPSPVPSPSPSPAPSSMVTPTPSPTPIVELRVSGTSTQRFPDIKVSPLKLGDIVIKNTTNDQVTFLQFQLQIDDAMNSSLNRNKTVIFKLRNGTSIFDSLISETNFLINREPPPYGEEANRRQLDVSFPITIDIGQTKTASVWIENLDYVVGGYLHVSMLTAYTNSVVPQGGFTFLLTNQ